MTSGRRHSLRFPGCFGGKDILLFQLLGLADQKGSSSACCNRDNNTESDLWDERGVPEDLTACIDGKLVNCWHGWLAPEASSCKKCIVKM